MNDKEILQLNMGNMPKAGRDEINRILELNEGILLTDNGAAAAKATTIDIVCALTASMRSAPKKESSTRMILSALCGAQTD